MPKPLDVAVPDDLKFVLASSGDQLAVAREDGLPWMTRVIVKKQGFWGFFTNSAKVTIGVKRCGRKVHIGLYGPDPALLGNATGKLGSHPKSVDLPHLATGTIKAGTYVLALFEEQADGSLTGLTASTAYRLEIGS
jgi:hypothetical protein